MRLIHWISKVFGVLVPSRSLAMDKTAFLPKLRRLKALPWVLVAVGCSSLMGGTAMAEPQHAAGTIVAAGFGYQIGDTSTITVKVYDAASGIVLSDESFELNVKEEGASSATPAPRIFAGGVGPGATDLSNFVLRVYDARTGAFQWEGQLNLTPQAGAGSGHLVSTVVPRRATVTKIHAPAMAPHQPLFLLRALDSMTGGLVWEDEFSTDGQKLGRFERIADRRAALVDAPVSRTFDFRIRVFESDGRTVAWEDQFAQKDAQDETAADVEEERAQLLQAWPEFVEPSAEPAHI